MSPGSFLNAVGNDSEKEEWDEGNKLFVRSDFLRRRRKQELRRKDTPRVEFPPTLEQSLFGYSSSELWGPVMLVLTVLEGFYKLSI